MASALSAAVDDLDDGFLDFAAGQTFQAGSSLLRPLKLSEPGGCQSSNFSSGGAGRLGLVRLRVRSLAVLEPV